MRGLICAALCVLLAWHAGCEAASPTTVNGPGSPPQPPGGGGRSPGPIMEAVSIEGLNSRQRRGLRQPPEKRPFIKGVTPGTPELPLVGELEGTWDAVDGYLTFPYRFPDPGFEGQVLLRGFDLSAPVGTTYRHDGWDRTVYWLDFDAGDPAKVPRLLAALQLVTGYQPQPGDDFPEFLADAAVVNACAAADCTINWVPYLLLREAGVDYTGYPDEAADASMYFVANASGEAVAAVMDISDINGDFERTDFLYEGDELELFTIVYRMSEPGFVYLLSVMHFETLGAGLAIERRHYIPGQDFQDPDLVEDLDAAKRPIRLLLDAQRVNPSEFQFGGPFDLGYTWGEVPDFLWGGNFESRAPVNVPANLVKRRQ